MPDQPTVDPLTFQLITRLLGADAYSKPDIPSVFPNTSLGKDAEARLKYDQYTPSDLVKSLVGHRGDTYLPNQTVRDPRLPPPTDSISRLLEALRAKGIKAKEQ